MNKKHYISKRKIRNMFILYSIYIIFILCLAVYGIIDDAVGIMKMIVLVLLVPILVFSLLNDLRKGLYDKISFYNEGIKIQKLFKTVSYAWNDIILIKHSQGIFGDLTKSKVITIKVDKIGKNAAFNIILDDYGEILDDIKQYYISNND